MYTTLSGSSVNCMKWKEEEEKEEERGSYPKLFFPSEKIVE